MRAHGQIIRRLGMGIFTLMLSACSILPPPEPQDIYRLPPSSVTASPGESVDISLRLSRPAVNDLLARKRIVVIPEGNRLSVYKGASWNSPTPQLWRDHLLEAFVNDGRIARLSRAEERLQAEVEFGGTLRALQVEYREGVPEVVIRLEARLVETASRRILASRRFAVREVVEGEQLPAVVEAFGRANDALAYKLIEWTVRVVQGLAEKASPRDTYSGTAGKHSVMTGAYVGISPVMDWCEQVSMN